MSRNRSLTAPAFLAFVAGILVCDLAGAVEPQQQGSFLDQKEFFKPELYISSSHEPLERVLPLLPNQADWRAFQQARQDAGEPPVPAFIDPRSGAATSLMGAFPVIPGDGFGNAVTLEEVGTRLGRQVRTIDGKTVADAARSFVLDHRRLLGIDATQLGEIRAVEVHPDLWQVSIPQTYHGIPVRHGRLASSINHGNVVVFGTETWGNVRGLSPKAKITADEAVQAGFNYAGGRSAVDEIRREPILEVIPVAPQEHQRGGAFAGPLGAGYRHRLVWAFVFERPPDDANWEVIVDAHSGEILAFQDINHYANGQITGGVYPLTSTEICPNPATCGTMQSGWPMPFADTGLPAPNDFTNSAGVFNYGGGTVTTTLTGRYVDIVDTCGSIINSSVTGNLDLGGINGQHDCVSAGGSPGNTASSRSAFYEVNKLAEQARGWLPTNPWLQSRLTTNVNLNNTCNAFYSFGGSINFYRSGGGCRNTGEIAGVFDHEWGHALDDNDSGGVLSSSSEAYADIAAIYRLQTSCIGHGFWWTQDKGCGQTADGTGFNANEDQAGGFHCDLDCSGVRDADWDKHADHTPDTALGFVCNSCASGSGPCGKQVHCAAAPSRQAAWDLVARDLRVPPFNYDSQTSFLIGNKLFYQGSGNIGSWHSCSCGVSSDGCGATNAYMQWLMADDDNGNLNDGTPHMTAIYNAFNRHGIACSAPTPQNSGCTGGPNSASRLNASLGSYQSFLSWSTAPGATRYWVFRTEGHAGCNYGKTLIAETTGTTYTDSQVANGRSYYYNVVAAGSSPACFGPVSNCAIPGSAQKDAQVLSQSVPSSMVMGQSYGVSITLKNVGTVTWSPVGPPCGAYRLGSVNPDNNTTWGTSRVELPAPVAPGGEVTLFFTVTAPLTPGPYNFQWRMVHECVEWFGDASPNVPVNVTPPPDFSIACNPSSLTAPQGGSGWTTCTVTSLHGFNSAVSLSCSGQPAGVTCGFAPNPATPPANGNTNSGLTVSVAGTTAPGTYSFQVQGTSGSLTHSTGMTLNVTAACLGCSGSAWVSVNGNDANDCSPATPCRTLSGALAKVSPGGEIGVLDSGDFGPVTINKAVSVIAKGVLGGIHVSTGSAITVNAGASDKVVLRGLTIDGLGSGLNGVSFVSGGSLYIENCVINNLSQYGIDFAPTNGSGKLFVTDTLLRNNGIGGTGGGLHLIATTGPGFVATVDGLRSENNVFGIKAETLGVITVRNSLAANNGFSGFSATTPASSGTVRMVVEDSVATHNGTNGVLANSLATVTISNVVVTNNQTGLNAASGGTILSFGNNKIQGNTTDGVPSQTVPNQ